MTVAILQPSYLPWLGYFDLMARSDQFVFLDDVQFTRRDWRNRNKIRTRDGWAWLTVPVIQKHKFDQSLLETKIDNSSNWKEKHRRTIRNHYAKAPYLDLYFPYFETIFNKEWVFLVDLCLETTQHLKKILNITTPTQRSSRMEIAETKAERILAICNQLGTTHYLTGDAAKNYLSQEDFLKHNVHLEYHNYRHPVYAQQFPEFVPHLSVIDLLFNHGEKSLDILRASE